MRFDGKVGLAGREVQRVQQALLLRRDAGLAPGMARPVVTGVALVQRIAREPEPVRQWYAQADAQAQLLNARAAAARFALRLAEQIEQAEPA